MSDGVSKALSALSPPGSEIAPRELAQQEVARSALRQISRFKHPALHGLIAARSKGISRRMYPAIVELKIAGRSLEDIAKRLDVSTDVLRPHLNRAMEEYRTGRLRIDGGNAVSEARKTGAEHAAQAVEDLTMPAPPLVSA